MMFWCRLLTTAEGLCSGSNLGELEDDWLELSELISSSTGAKLGED